MADSIRCVPFVEKALSYVWMRRQLCVKELDGDARAVSVGCAEDGRHATDAQHGIESPAVAEHLPDARLGLPLGRDLGLCQPIGTFGRINHSASPEPSTDPRSSVFTLTLAREAAHRA